MEGSDLCLEIVKRARAGFVYSEAVSRYSVYIVQCVHSTVCTLFVVKIECIPCLAIIVTDQLHIQGAPKRTFSEEQ